MSDSDNYRQKKQFFNQMLTVYGRKPVLEALQEPSARPYRLHLASSNKPGGIIAEIMALAESKAAEIVWHDRQELSRISRNSKQDQGVALDLICEGYRPYQEFLGQEPAASYDIIALDRITNPQNLGMIIRSVAASGCAGLLLPEKGCAKLDALVIKASAGTLFRAPVLRCQQLEQALDDFAAAGANIYGLSSHAKTSIGSTAAAGRNVFVLGNETDGVSEAVARRCNKLISIPMSNGVESLNVAVTASLLAFRHLLQS
ncbi:RNA methyltransferase [Pseudomaricurvus sp. HS19]|uniref:TrmH family RNA methyltransferase n=1 Tax=Pseudomaricurvus sp. HS19 TaxID=2692626 RepID=UPI00136D04B6|nr:RNA methyltransferase [Pseudomaricurvus sp. HS19]MYM62666.1 23S rRNA (guanosine(2251)-2'-O)-methyltransferase RlmB [Pseudomaricurvus sp. HS19]